MARLLALLYGITAYVLFLGTFLYAIGFLARVVVPKDIDDGVASATGTALAVNLLLLAVFGLQHSIMARPAFKKWWTKFVPQPIERSTYVLITCVILGLIFWQWRPMASSVWNLEHPATRIVLQGMFWVGIGTVLLSTFLIDHFDLFGLRQVWSCFRGEEYREPEFKVWSLYRLVRHPLMLGFMIAFWGTPTMTVGHLLFAIVTTLYMLVAIHIEERDLLSFHGDEYDHYRRSVSMILPLPRKNSQTGGPT